MDVRHRLRVSPDAKPIPGWTTGLVGTPSQPFQMDGAALADNLDRARRRLTDLIRSGPESRCAHGPIEARRQLGEFAGERLKARRV